MGQRIPEKEIANFQFVGIIKYSFGMASVQYPVPLLCKETSYGKSSISNNRLLFTEV